MKKNLFGHLIFVALSFALSGVSLISCGGTDSAKSGPKNITIKGSDTLVRIGQEWAEVYMQKTPAQVIQVSGGGTGTGIAALLNGVADICQASRDMKQEEYDIAREKGIEPYRIAVALDGIAVYVHKTNLISHLSMRQLKDIYRGRITDWSELGAQPGKIILYSRENNSGTYAYFKEHVLDNEDFDDRTQALPGTAAVVNAISKDPLGIGYGGIAWATETRSLPISSNDSLPAIEPNTQTIVDGSYPISRELYWFTNGKPKGHVRELTNWVLSPEGQALANEAGYVSLPAQRASEQLLP